MTDGGLPSFQQIFGAEPDIVASAPGRVNLMGEHTDYNGGWVLPIATPQRTQVELRRRGDRLVRAWSANVGRSGELVRYPLGEESPSSAWFDYLQGITRVIREAGHPIFGFDARITSDVPLGSGLSSSAALEVALLRALRAAFDLRIDDVELAKLGQRAENDFVGAPVGIMDQMASSLADTTNALFLDTRTLMHETVQFPAAVELVVIDSGVTHTHASGDYRTRRAECERAARALGVPQLRDLSAADKLRIDALEEPLGRRVRHVLAENARVFSAVAAMRSDDPETLGRLFYESHESMRADYEVSTPEIDVLVELARSEPDVYGGRLTGGGFGGSVVVLARFGRGRAIADHLASTYALRTGRTPSVLMPRADSGHSHA